METKYYGILEIFKGYIALKLSVSFKWPASAINDAATPPSRSKWVKLIARMANRIKNVVCYIVHATKMIKFIYLYNSN